MSKARTTIPIEMPSISEDRKINAAARSDPHAQLLSPSQLKALVPLRGRPKSDSKKLLVSVRYSPEVLAYFRSTGEGWQARMDGVLRQCVQRQSRQT